MFLGVPHFGTKASFVASLLSTTTYWRGSSTLLLRTISKGNRELHKLDERFRDASRWLKGPKIGMYRPYICNFLETRPEKMLWISLGLVRNFSLNQLRRTFNLLTID
jgi:hypothetical protein